MKPNRPVKFSVRFSKDELVYIEKKAAEEGCTASEWVRRCVLSKQNKPDKSEILGKILKRVTEVDCLLLQHYEEKGDGGFVQRAKTKAMNSLNGK